MGRIPKETLERIAAATDIVELIGRHFPLKRAGATFRALCPFHDEKTPSFHVNPARQRFHCFGCGADGSAFDFVMLYEHVDFATAARRLAERAGIPVVSEEFSPADDRRRRLLALHQEAASWFHRNLLTDPGAAHARAYLQSRAISSAVAKAWKIGYAPKSYDACGAWARQAGFTPAELLDGGLVKQRDESAAAGATYDRFRDRVMFPIDNDQGEVVAFSGRTIAADAKEAKYVNSPETPIFTKGRLLFGLHRSKRPLIKAGAAIVLEGQLDLITAFEAGIENVVAPQGTAFTAAQAHLLRRFVEEAILCYDADAAGDKAATRTFAALAAEGVFVRVARMPAGHDPDSLIRAEGADAFRERIAGAKDYFDHLADRGLADPGFATPRGKLAVARQLAEALAAVADGTVRETTLLRCTARLRLPENELRAMIRLRPRPAGGWGATDGGPPEAEAPAPVEPAISLLCHLALVDAATREWLLGRPWEELVAGEPDGELLALVLRGGVEPGNAAALNAFLGMLPADRQAALALALASPIPDTADALRQAATDCWRLVESRALRRRQDLLTARLRRPEIPLAEAMEIQQVILDLQRRQADVSRSFP